MEKDLKLIFGTEKQLEFADIKDFYMSFGMVCNPNIFTISYEMNKKNGSYSNAYRLRVLSSCRKLLTPSLEKAVRSQNRINCNEYVEYLIDNYNVVEKSGDVICNITEILKSIPNEFVAYFMKGYTSNASTALSKDETKKISYTIDADLNLYNDLEEVALPTISTKNEDKKDTNKASKSSNKKTDYILREITNTYIGDFGEEKVYMNECIKLKNTSNNPKWVSREDDSLGYDIESYDLAGNKIYIEVKSTPYGPTTPFFMSKNELDSSKKYGDNYYIYRVYNLKKKCNKYYYFILRGDVEKNEHLCIEKENSKVSIK